ncbi:MAG: hypothetical protein RL417_2067 [Pseudomonadota bacterium]
MDTSARIVVIGGGVVGYSIALALLRRGSSVVQVCPKAGRETSASFAAGAMLGAFGEVTAAQTSALDDAETAFRVECGRRYEGWLQSLEAASGTAVSRGWGTFIVANTFSRGDLRNLEAIEQALTRYGESYEVVREDQVPGYQPNERYLPRRILWLPREGWLDSGALLGALAGAVTRYSSYTARDGVAAEVIVREGRATGARLQDGTVVEGDQVVIAAGIGTTALLDALPIPLAQPRLMPGKGTAILLATPIRYEHAIRSPNRHFACGLHIVPRNSGQIYVGATNRTAACPGTAPGASVEEIHDLLHQVVHEFHTGLDAAVVSAIRVGHRPISLDGYPLIGATAMPQLAIATGTYRNGILMAPLIGEAIAALIHGEIEAERGALEAVRPFSPLDRRVPAHDVGAEAFLRGGAEAIVSFLPSPHGGLPYARAHELAGFLERLLTLAVRDDVDAAKRRADIRALLERQPLHETFAQLFFHEP